MDVMPELKQLIKWC